MKLTYRGVSYNYNPPEVKAADAIATGRYRGSGYRLRQVQATIAQQPGLDLKYRGVAYATLPNLVDAEEAPAVVPAVATAPSATASTESNMRSLAMHHHRAAKQREQSMLSRIANQVGLSPEFAAHYWNPIQGKIGHDALDAYDRSHVAFS
ncbi:MAG TPA: DUF4278 domain-containing protein [Crinalium sp.]|jgi:hypothetical protein